MAQNPEQTGDAPLSKPGVESNEAVQDGADKVYDRPKAKGKNTILLVSLLLLIALLFVLSRYLF